MGEIPHSEKMFHLPIEVSVYVPSTQDVDKVVSKSEMKLRVDEVKKYLATLFGGFSSSSVEGGFLASDGKVVKENVERVVSFAPKEDFDKNKEALVQKASEWATKWGQEAIGLEHEGDLYYVPQKFENGGTIAIREAKEMANSQALEIKHHASELANALKGNPTIEAWVIAKLERASNDLADVTHYLEGRVKMSGKKMANGGSIEPKSNDVQFIKYRDEEIMYDPIFQEFFVNDVMFKTLQEARVFIDKGAPMSDEITEAYRKGLFATGGSMENNGFDDTGTSLAFYHEKTGNWLVPKGQVYLWLYNVEGSAKKLKSGEFDYVFYPITSMTMAFQSGYVPPLKRIWAKKFQKANKGSEHLLGVIRATLSEDGKQLDIDMMSVNPTKKKKGIMSYMIQGLRDIFKLTQDQVTFSDLTKEGEGFVSKKKYAEGGNMEFERPSYQSNYVASQDKSDYVDISDENWNTDLENDPVYKAQQSIKEKAKKQKELATRAGMAYLTRGASEMGGLGKSMSSEEKVALGTEGEPNSGNKLSELASLLGKK